jgi:phosphomethylpyrimidine synthase
MSDMTILESAKHGKITEEIRLVAEAEGRDPEEIRALVAGGRVVIPKNRLRHDLRLAGIGQGLKVKVNANIGTSRDYANLDDERAKLEVALEAGADAVMDLSTGGDLDAIREDLLSRCIVPFGTVPVYELIVGRQSEWQADGYPDGVDEILAVVERQARQGVDFMTLHCGVTRRALEALKRDPRLVGVVSRGGALALCWMERNGCENPLYSEYDRVLELLREYDVTISLGDGLRPGGIADSTDTAQLVELETLGELVHRARAAGVQAMVEGPGHIPLHEIALNVELEKRLCDGAPFYVLGPLPTDVAAGYDHVASAIGGAIAAMHGADFLCYVTPAEHLGLPTPDDVREGVITSRIAAHSADVARGLPSAVSQDRAMARARRDFDWKMMQELALAPRRFSDVRGRRPSGFEDVCSMCGDVCPMRSISQYVKGAVSQKGDG